MPVILLFLLLGVLAYLYWKRRTSNLTRNCRWRQRKAQGDYVCAYCGGTSVELPRHCVHSPDQHV
ncbi:hypothetical protein GG681_06685 [Epibacterium sp. SM1969]|uniref:Uncharacterized protein n=1 Tax=Tritonibacter aquimaris TaxID=2663379 RepID=A0A844AWM2_9RHOB|nr:hypothetical protein [Tritonibacter aquimaris]MQY42322.1 hypothetical protein [Tritonibacter aquimaris]